MALAHEIVVNGDFRIKPVELPEDSLEKRIKDIVHKAFWDCLGAQLGEDPPAYDHAIKLVGEIRETLLSFLLPGHTRLRNQITEVLDLDLIKQEAEHGALDISRLAEFIIGVMGTLCAPARDEDVQKLKDITEIVPLFRAIFAVLDMMKVDMANFAVSSIRPHLMQQSVEYERRKFQELLEKQPSTWHPCSAHGGTAAPREAQKLWGTRAWDTSSPPRLTGLTRKARGKTEGMSAVSSHHPGHSGSP